MQCNERLPKVHEEVEEKEQALKKMTKKGLKEKVL